MKAVYIEEFGGPGVLKIDDLPVPKVNPNQVLIQVDRNSNVLHFARCRMRRETE